MPVKQVEELFKNRGMDDAIAGNQQNIVFALQSIEHFQGLPGGMGGAELLSLVGENNIFKGTTDGFDNLSGQGADNQDVLLYAAFIINFNGAVDSGLPRL